jgi:hypothetical protein
MKKQPQLTVAAMIGILAMGTTADAAGRGSRACRRSVQRHAVQRHTITRHRVHHARDLLRPGATGIRAGRRAGRRTYRTPSRWTFGHHPKHYREAAVRTRNCRQGVAATLGGRRTRHGWDYERGRSSALIRRRPSYVRPRSHAGVLYTVPPAGPITTVVGRGGVVSRTEYYRVPARFGYNACDQYDRYSEEYHVRGYYGSTHDSRYHGIDPVTGVNSTYLIESISTTPDLVDRSRRPIHYVETIPKPADMVEGLTTPADMVEGLPTPADLVEGEDTAFEPITNTAPVAGGEAGYIEGEPGGYVVGPNVTYVVGGATQYEVAAPPEAADLPPNEPPTFLEQGEAAFASGNYEESRRLFRRAVVALPDDAYALLDYALAHFALGEYQIAADAFRRALSLDPDLLDRMPDISTAYGRVSDFETHLARLDGWLAKHPSDNDARFLYGLVFYSVGDPRTAVGALSRALHRDSKDTSAFLLRDAALRAIAPEKRTRTIVIKPD